MSSFSRMLAQNAADSSFRREADLGLDERPRLFRGLNDRRPILIISAENAEECGVRPLPAPVLVK